MGIDSVHANSTYIWPRQFTMRYIVDLKFPAE